MNDKTNHPYLRIVDMKNNTIIDDDIHYISEDVFAKIKQYIITDKDLYITIAGTIGNVGIIPSKYNNANLTENAVRVTPLLINKKYLMYLILSNYVQNQFIDKTHHVAMPKLAIERIKGVLIPIPPIQEQNRIVETVGTLLQLVETIDSDKIDLSNLIKQTKAKVLDLAIKGKLVPQDDNDEPADKLLEKIREEKEKLIKEGKIKRDKNETFIFKSSDDNSYYEQIDGETVCIDDDLPFEIPNSWRWCSLGNIGDWGAGSTPNRNKFEYYNNGTIPWLKTGDLNDSFIENIPEHITEQALKETSVSIKPKGSILIAMYGATIGKLGILNIDSTTNQACCACKCIKINNLYLFYYLMSQRNKLKEMGMGGAQPNISKEVFLIRRINTAFPNATKVFAHPFINNPQAQFEKHNIKSNCSYKNYKQNSVGKIYLTPVQGDIFAYRPTFKPDRYYYTRNIIKKILKQQNTTILIYASKSKIYSKKLFEDFKEYLDLCDEITDANALEIIKELQEYIGAKEYEKVSNLITMMKKGVVIHHGSIPLKARFLIEKFINSGYAKICFATSTLLQGINMPFDLVWIDNYRFRGNKDKKSLEIKNLIGRA